jgi:hypothetical protein
MRSPALTSQFGSTWWTDTHVQVEVRQEQLHVHVPLFKNPLTLSKQLQPGCTGSTRLGQGLTNSKACCLKLCMIIILLLTSYV